MATNQNSNLFAPLTDEEKAELEGTPKGPVPMPSILPPPPRAPKDIFAPVTQEELLDAEGATAIQKEIATRSFWDRPSFMSQVIKNDEINEIAARHKVDPATLREYAPLLGVNPEDPEFRDYRRRLLYYISGGGLPMKLVKKLETDEMEAAMDELGQLASARASYVQKVAEMAVPVGGATKTVPGAMAAGAGVGYATSTKEQELEGTLFGAGTGGVLQRVLGRTPKTASKVEREAAQDYVQRNRPDLEAGTEKLLAERRASEEILEAAQRGERKLSQADTERVLKEQMSPDSLNRYLDPGSKEYAVLRERAVRNNSDTASQFGTRAAVKKQLADDIVESRAKDFAEDLTGTRPNSLKEAREVTKDYFSRQGGEEEFARRLNLFKEEKAAEDYITRHAVRSGRGDHLANKALDFMSDAQFVLRGIDDSFQTGFEPVHRSLNKAYNRMGYARNEARKELNDLFEKNKAIDARLTEGGDVYRALDKGDTSLLNRAEMKAYEGFNKYFNEWLDYVNGLVKSRDPDINPLSIPKRENYVPHLMKTPEDLSKALGNRVELAQREASALTGRQVSDLAQLSSKEFSELLSKSKDLQELKRGMEILDGRPITSGADVSSRYKDLFRSRDGRIRLDTVARAALERHNFLPEWMREQNLYKLADRWVNNTLKHLYLRRDMDKLASLARRVDKAGGHVEAEYVRTLLQDINGIRKGTGGEVGAILKERYQQGVDNMNLSKPLNAVMKAVPEILSDMNRQIYPSALGLNPKAVLLQATQLFTKTAPELGTKYGYGTIARGAAHALLNMPKQLRRMREMGFVPAEFTSKYRRAVADGIRRSSMYALPSEAVNKMGDWAMYLFTKMDAVNRAISLSVADVMAHDLRPGGSKLAQEALRKFPPTVQRQVARARSEQEVAEILGSHLNSATQYNYNRASMSEWGRTMGPLFSTFSKWPTATVGEIVQEFRDKGVLKGSMRNTEKYIVPLLLLQMMDMAIFGEGPTGQYEEGDRELALRKKIGKTPLTEDVVTKIVGKSGLSAASPLGGIKAMATGDFFSPPAVDAVMQGVVIPTLNQDEGKLAKGLDNIFYNFTPGTVYAKFILDDLVTYGTGDRPEGSTFVERSIEGANELSK